MSKETVSIPYSLHYRDLPELTNVIIYSDGFVQEQEDGKMKAKLNTRIDHNNLH